MQNKSWLGWLLAACFLCQERTATAFMITQPTTTTPLRRTKTDSKNMALSASLFDPSMSSSTMMMDHVQSISSTLVNNHFMLLSTIDADVANIPDNEFKTVFAGGLAVMAGGLISAVVVGVLLESGDMYDALAAESYEDLAKEDAFWDSMTEEETEQWKMALSKLKGTEASEEGGGSDKNKSMETAPTQMAAQDTTTTEKPSSSKDDMFSDYGS